MAAQTFEQIRKNADTKTHSAAVLVVRDGKFLVGERSDGRGLCGPGGHAEWGETPQQAAKREAKEEFNIIPLHLRPLNRTKFGNTLSKTVYFWTDELKGEPQTDEVEMLHARWLSESELRKRKLLPNFEDSLNRYMEQNRRPET